MTTDVRTLARQTRSRPIEVRGVDDAKHQVTLRAVVYDVWDSYDTQFAPALFAESLQQRMPTLAWGHDWSDPIGRCVDYTDTPTHIDTLMQLDYDPDVPRARQAWVQLRSKTIDECSVGFFPRAWEVPDPEVLPQGVDPSWARRFTKADLDEVSLVLRGAVPGAEVVSTRGQRQGVSRTSTIDSIPAREAVRVMHRLFAGEISLDQAQRIVLGMPTRGTVTLPTPPTTGDPDPEEPDEDEAEAERTARLAQMDLRMRAALRMQARANHRRS